MYCVENETSNTYITPRTLQVSKLSNTTLSRMSLLKRHWITPLIPSLTTTEDEEVEIDPEQVSKVEKILLDLADGVVDETLPRLTVEDVAFNIDEIVSYTKFHEISLSPMSQKCDLDKYQSIWPSRF